MARERNEIIASMNNVADSGQDPLVTDYAELARITLYEMGVSKAYLSSEDAAYVLGKATTDLLEDGNLSTTTMELIKTLRVNHPHSEDK